MWEYVNQYVSYNTLYHSGVNKEKTALQESCLTLLIALFYNTPIKWFSNIAVGNN